MATPSQRRMAAAMWANRPSLSGLLLTAIVVLSVHVVTGVPVLLPVAVALAVVLAGTWRQSHAVREPAEPFGEVGHAAH